MNHRWLLVGGLVGLLAVIFGAFGAHGIEEAIPHWYGLEDLPESKSEDLPESKSTITPIKNEAAETLDQLPQWYRLDQLHLKKLRTWITGVRYHFYHALSILLVGALIAFRPTRCRSLEFAAWFFLLGIIGFSGSIYIYVISKVKLFGMTAAIGGMLFVCGWICFVWGMLRWKPIPAKIEPRDV